ncbi:hypothetical protein KJ059_11380 [Myxococcota bacterium]|nr:hypothetical protein [Myxococcota bacterium]
MMLVSPSSRRVVQAGILLSLLGTVFLGCHDVHFDPNLKAGEIQIYDDLFSVSVPTPDHVVAAGYWGAVYVSQDGGETWRSGETGTRSLLYGVSMADDRRGWAVGQAGIILRTEDGGLTWVQQENPKQAEGTHLFAVHAIDANTAWAVGDWGTRIFTDNGGKSWQDFSLVITEEHPQFVWLSPPEQERVRTGQKVFEDVGLTDVFCLPQPSQSCWIIGEFGYIFRSETGGTGWERASIQQDISVPPIVLPFNEIEITEESQAQLTQFAKDILGLSHLNVAIDPMASPEEVAAFGKESDPFPLFDILEARTQSVSAVLEEAGMLSDRIRKRGSPPWDFEDFLKDDPEFLQRYLEGRTQEHPGINVTISQNPYLFSVRFANEDEGYIAGLGGVVLVSKDGGRNWTYQETGLKQAIFSVFPSRDRVIAVGEKGYVRVSTDGGATWEKPGAGFPNVFTFMRDIWFAPGGESGYIVGERGKVLRTTDGGQTWTAVLPPPGHEVAAGG